MTGAPAGSSRVDAADPTRTLRALLFDLDDTLLGNPMERFVPAYLEALADFAAPVTDPQRVIAEVLRATRAMAVNDGGPETNEEVFAAHFYPGLGGERAVLEPLFERFYAEGFPGLEPLTEKRPEARGVIEWALHRGLQVVIATNPLFPRTAIEQRMAWAGIGVGEFTYDLVTTYENMHATKSHPAYFTEILERIGRRPQECLMVGDDWRWDVVNAGKAGIPAYWIAARSAPRPEPRPAAPLCGQGSLADFWAWARAWAPSHTA